MASDPIFVFPQFEKVGEVAMSYGGMTLRDWFAGQAISGMLAAGVTIDIDGERLGEKRAATAYVIADAMLAERDK